MMAHPYAVETDINARSHIQPKLYAWGLAMIVPWSSWSIARIRREHRPDIELPETKVSAEDS